MASSTSGTFVAVFTCLWIFVLTSADQQQITVKTGDDVTLSCLDHRGGDIELLEWTRLDLEDPVFVWKHGTMLEDPQHPSLKNRVELRDPQMKDGDVSVILKNVTINDTGTYECRVKNNNTPTPPQIITNINLNVTDSGHDKHKATKDGGNKDGGNNDRGDKCGGNNVTVLLITVSDVFLVLIVAAAVCGIVIVGGVVVLGFMMFQRCQWKKKKNSDLTTSSMTQSCERIMIQ